MLDNEFSSLIDAIKKGKFVARIDKLRVDALEGDDVSAIALGYIYFRGSDVPKDYAEALYWFNQVDSNYDQTGFAAGHLAILYYNGLGVTKDHRMAAKYLRTAALRGHRRSGILFAHLQKKGDGTLKKPRSAKKTLRANACDRKLSLMTRFLSLLWLLF